MSTLIKRRRQCKPRADEILLSVLAEELRSAVKSAKASIDEAIKAVDDTLEEARLMKKLNDTRQAKGCL
jgi:hypothetical protein